MHDAAVLPERMTSKIDFSGLCWIWTGGRRDRDGYGRVFDGGKEWLAHRAIYTRLVGPIPSGLTIDHLCRNRACVNPNHLEPVTHKINTLRGNTLQAANAAKTHCHRGHEFDPVNTRLFRGMRRCRSCDRDRSARYRARQKGQTDR
jgi:hypothetical protein